jgi:predicted amidohydrolase YtcJ
VYPDLLDDVIAAGLRTGDPLPGGRGLAAMGPLKVITDGSLNTRTAWCSAPYADAHPGVGGGGPRGVQNYPPEVLVPLVARAAAAGLAVALHAIGDAAIADVLDAFEATGARGSVEHAQLARPDEIARMARLGIAASVQPAHLLDDRDVSERCWPDRTAWCFPFGDMLRAGVELRLGSDAPVAPLDPWLAMAAAVHRSGDDRPAWHPEQALTAEEALAASTDGQRTLTVGDVADLALLDDDPFVASAGADVTATDSAAIAARLRAIRVAATFVGGRPTHLAL